MNWRGRIQHIFAAALALSVAACSTEISATPKSPIVADIATANPGAETLVREFVDAYQSKNLGRMMTLVHQDITWLSVEGDDTNVILQGEDAFQREMAAFFKPDANLRSDVEILKSHGPYVTTLERAYWTHEGEEKSQASFAVYQFEENTIARVWYFPASQ